MGQDKKELIIAGNPNKFNTSNAIYFAKKLYGDIGKVFFIDSDDSIYHHNGSPVESERNDIVRKHLLKDELKDDVVISQKIFPRDRLHEEVPRILSEELFFYKPDQIIIDFTNADRFISGVLYASATFSKIDKLFYLFVQPERREEEPNNLNPEDYKVYP